MDKLKLTEAAEKLVEKSTEASATDALKYSQAACNVASTLRMLSEK